MTAAGLPGWTHAGFTVFGTRILWTDLIGNVCALGTVWLAKRRTIWTWPVQLVGAVLLLIASVSAHLGGNALKQALFIVLAAYGWWRWSRGMRTGGGLAVRPATARERWALVGALAVGTALVAFLLARFGASWSPLPDAYIFVGSAVATFGQSRALLDFWWIWIAVDAVGVPLAFRSGLWGTGGVYGVFLVLCLNGFLDWRREYRRRTRRDPRAEAVAA